MSPKGVKVSPDITPTLAGAVNTSPARCPGGSATPIAVPSASRTRGIRLPASRLPPGQVATTS